MKQALPELVALERRLRGLPESAMRREVVLEALETAEPEDAVALLSAALHRRETDRPALPALHRAAHEVLVDGGATRPLGYELRAELYRLAAERGDERLSRLLRSASAEEVAANPAAGLPRDLAEIPLGLRRSLARGIDHDLLERLLRDPDPMVIDHLLENPHISEDDVVRIASRRPIAGPSLERIHRSRRFGARTRVRVALARNPYCPTNVAIASLPGVDLATLREISRDANLHAEVRRHAREEVERRRPQ